MAASKLPQQFGQYVLQELIARGGMAEIYRATTHGVGGFEKTVAIKKILPHLAENDEFITMLIDEARIIVNLSHANIAQVYDLGKIAEDYYIAMEYIHGTDLSTIAKELKESNRTMPVEHALFIAAGIAAGLHVAHAKCDANGLPEYIVHRDVSPHNILLSFAGDVKIIDFGVAKARGKEAHTQVGVIKGKLLYMAPEQAMGKELDGRADLFAMGLILYRLLTNHLPFEGDNEFQIYNNILSKPVTPPRVYNPNLPEEVNQIVMMLLQRDPSKRYQDGYSAKVDLDRALQRVAPGYSMARLSRWVESEFSHLIAQRKLTHQSGQNDRPVTPSHAHNANITDAGFTPPPQDWEDFDEGEDTLNVSMNSPEAQAMLDRVRAERAAAGKDPAPPSPPWNVDEPTNESPSSWQKALQQPTVEQPQVPRPSAGAPDLHQGGYQQADAYSSAHDPYARANPQHPSYGEPAGSGMFPTAGQHQQQQQQQQYGNYGEEHAPHGSGMFPTAGQHQQQHQHQQQYGNYGEEHAPHGSGMFPNPQQPATSGMFPHGQRPDADRYAGQPAGSGMFPNPQWPEADPYSGQPAGSGMFPNPQWPEADPYSGQPAGSGMFPMGQRPDPNMYGAQNPAGSGIFGAPPPNASGAIPAYYGPSRQSGAFGALGQLPPQPAQPYETYAPQAQPQAHAPATSRFPKRLVAPLVVGVLLLLAIIVMVLVNATSGDEPEIPVEAGLVEGELAIGDLPGDELGEVIADPELAEDEVEPAPAEVAPETVVFNATTEPAGAAVFLADEELGTTPLEVEIPRGEDEVALRFELDGYEPQQLAAIPFNDFKRNVELKQIAPEPKPQDEPAPEKATKKPEPKKPEPKKSSSKKSEPKKSSTKKSSSKKSEPKKASIPLLGEEPPKTSDADIPLF